jgi:hypothetical protein
MAIGRITGPLLKADLIRDGVNLAFETDLLYLDVNNSRIGVNTSSPTTDLDVNGTTKTVTLRVDNQADIGNLSFTGNTISSSTSIIDFTASGGEATVYHSRLSVDDIEIQGNKISTVVSNSPLEIRPNGSGTIELQATTNVTGNLNVTGNVSAVGNVVIGGNIVIGDNPIDDTITINARIESDLIPDLDNTRSLGSSSKQWRNVYVNNFYTTSINLPTLDIGNLMFRDNEITTTTGQDVIIDGNGSGGVRLANFKFVDNTITNVVSGAISTIQQTGTGYFKIATTNGFVFPVGSDAQRPTAYAVVGMTRYNTNSKALEVWDGTDWASPAGAAGAVSEITANDIAIQIALTLG